MLYHSFQPFSVQKCDKCDMKDNLVEVFSPSLKYCGANPNWLLRCRD